MAGHAPCWPRCWRWLSNLPICGCFDSGPGACPGGHHRWSARWACRWTASSPSRDGAFRWTGASEEQFRFHLEQVGELGLLSVRPQALWTMLVLGDGSGAARGPSSGIDSPASGARSRRSSSAARSMASRATPRLAEASTGRGGRCGTEATDKDVSHGGAGLAARVQARPDRRAAHAPPSRSWSVAARRSCRRSATTFCSS